MSIANGPAAPVRDVDPFGDEFLEDPYAAHRDLRDAGPVVWLSRYRVWAMARYEEVDSVLRDPETFCSGRGAGLTDFARETPWRPPSLLLEADPPDHTPARRAITSVISPRVVKSMRDTFKRVADEMVAGLVRRKEFDGIGDLAAAFPLKVMPDEIGLPVDGRDNLLPYGNMAFNGFGPRNRRFEAAMQHGVAAQEWIMNCTRRASLTDGGLGARIHAAAEAEGFGEHERELLVRSVLTAGIDTTVHGIGNALLCFAQHPDQWDVLRGDPGLARQAFEEAVRFESPVQTFFRTSTRQSDVAGVTIPADEKVLLFLAGANRDPRHWGVDAEEFDIARTALGHVGFGAGIHACVGQMIARLEGELVLRALAERFGRIELAGAPIRQLNNTLRGLDTLPLRLDTT